MNITSHTLVCTQVGDGWLPLETSPDGVTWTGQAPGAGNAIPAAHAALLKMWLKGVTITGSVQAADANSANFPELSGPANGYRMGLIQIIKKLPVMFARYEGYKYRRWLQRTIPFFDSTGVADSPWYNAGTRANLANNANVQVTLQDYPTTIALLTYDGTPGGGRLEEMQKSLDFDVFLAVAPITAKYKQQGLRILRHVSWTSETHLKFEWAGNNFTVTATKFVRTATAPTALLTAAASKQFVTQFPISAEGANEAISSSDLR